MKVKILSHTPNLESVIAAAGKLCYSKVGVDGILEKSTKEDNERFVKMLADMGHESPLEHVSFTFAIEGISRACSHQLVRHRIASYSQQSQRYVNLDKTFDYVMPPNIKKEWNTFNAFDGAIHAIYNTYIELTGTLFSRYVEEGISKYECENQCLINEKAEKEIRRNANKKAIEDARYILPNACETKLVFTMNVRTLLNFFEKRCCSRAQWEIRDLANEMLEQCREISPILFNNAGATCNKGYCKEGQMSCNPKYRK